ncbi:MAG: hypothetical protein QOC94_1887 [Actinoplanes sp.]|nr:hypothetical protein [Actinoplanes sp.]
MAESTTTPSELVQPLTELLLATLATSGGDHDRAEFLLRYENPAHKHTALGGGVLRAVGPATGEASWEDSAEIDFPDAHPRKTMWNLARRAIEIGVPIRTLHYGFDRGADGEWQHRLAVETLTEWEALRTELRPLRKRIEAELAPLVVDGWTRIYLDHQATPPRTSFSVRVGGDEIADQASQAVHDWSADLTTFLRQRGRGLISTVFSLAGEPDDWQSSFSVFYGLEPALA